MSKKAAGSASSGSTHNSWKFNFFGVRSRGSLEGLIRETVGP